MHILVLLSYNPREYYEKNPELKKVVDQIQNGFFNPGDPKLFEPLVDHLLYHDTYVDVVCQYRTRNVVKLIDLMICALE